MASCIAADSLFKIVVFALQSLALSYFTLSVPKGRLMSDGQRKNVRQPAPGAFLSWQARPAGRPGGPGAPGRAPAETAVDINTFLKLRRDRNMGPARARSSGAAGEPRKKVRARAQGLALSCGRSSRAARLSRKIQPLNILIWGPK